MRANARMHTASCPAKLAGLRYAVLVLAPRAVIAAATGLHNTLNEVTVPAAWFSIPAIDQELILKVTLTSFAIHVV